MSFTEEDKILINTLFDLYGYNSKHFVREFSSKGCNVGLIYHVAKSMC